MLPPSLSLAEFAFIEMRDPRGAPRDQPAGRRRRQREREKATRREREGEISLYWQLEVRNVWSDLDAYEK